MGVKTIKERVYFHGTYTIKFEFIPILGDWVSQLIMEIDTFDR